MSKGISPDQLGAAIEEQLTIYHREVTEQVDAAGESVIKALVKQTRATAPVRTGSFRKNITWTALPSGLNGKRYVWHVKPPDHRIAHLVVHGHAKQDGGRVPGNPFLQNALNTVLPEYERTIEEALK